MSHLLEAYIRLTTGVSVAESAFKMAEPPVKVSPSLSNQVMTARTQQAASIPPAASMSSGVVFHVSAPPPARKKLTGVYQPVDGDVSNPVGVHGVVTVPSLVDLPAGRRRISVSSPPPAPSRTINNVAQVIGNASRVVEHVMHDLKNVQHMQQTMTSVSDPSAVTRSLVVPKQFDRVFNVIVDPNEFEVDVSMMTMTPHGRDALAQLVEQGIIVAETSLSNVRFLQADFHSERYKHVVRDVNEGDLIFDKYFVAIETFDELRDDNR
jgi:hypothetical protein